MSSQYILCHGLPGSGKSTWAEELVKSDPSKYVRINRDDIRERLFGQEYAVSKPQQKKEQEVTRVQQDLISENLKKGRTVIDDNTNLNPHFLPGAKQLAEKNGAEITQQYFDVPIEECKRRNKARAEAGGRLVPDHVIDRMAKKSYGNDGKMKDFRIGSKTCFVYDKQGSVGEKSVHDFNADMKEKYPVLNTATVNFDMDGTLVDTRANSDQTMYTGDGSKRNFHDFHNNSEFDPANQDILDMAHKAHEEGLTVTVTTARSDDYSKPTINWLRKHGVPVSRLYMRKAGDFRSDYEVKKEILAEVEAEGLTFAHCVDDNPQAVQSWVENDIMVTRVPYHESQKYDPNRVYEPIKVPNPIGSGTCIRCGSPLKNGGTIGPKCRLK